MTEKNTTIKLKNVRNKLQTTQKELRKSEFFLSLKGANNEDFKKRWTY